MVMHSEIQRIFKWSLLLSKVQRCQFSGKMKQNLHQVSHYPFKCQTNLFAATRTTISSLWIHW